MNVKDLLDASGLARFVKPFFRTLAIMYLGMLPCFYKGTEV